MFSDLFFPIAWSVGLGSLGFLCFLGVDRLVYPWLFWRYEARRRRGKGGLAPWVVVECGRVLFLIGFPVLGFWMG